jgi:hypothetical protein
LGLGEFGPDGHAAADDAVGEQPEEGSGSGLLDFVDAEAGSFLASGGELAVTLGAVKVEKLGSGGDGIGIVF